MPLRTYRTMQGDMIDEIAWRVYGYSAKATEAIIEANRHVGLSEFPEELPGGILINLPKMQRPSAPKTVKLWD